MQKGFTYYRCHTKACPRSCIREEALEEDIKKLFSLAQLTEEEFEGLQNLLDELKDDWEKDQEALIVS
ncbi:MAG: hypothetical protein GWN01_01790, partial [Nitrosopumilaceae archaeon]|nr:hypothetical protein [Nitrosopumilaceae archaeon]NIU86096.1 hypothetical protein [Nitrosopumilaceae archaeon]NIV64842.1 hypothetical protein [Nitrosopumilaceae archaeon]NIX60307.1 hypothetical protein [Nitrosopumilaceae archaeon]